MSVSSFTGGWVFSGFPFSCISSPPASAFSAFGLIRAWCGRSMKATSAPIASAVFIARYSGEYGVIGYHTANRAGISAAGLTRPFKPRTLLSSRYDEYIATGGSVLASTTCGIRSFDEDHPRFAAFDRRNKMSSDRMGMVPNREPVEWLGQYVTDLLLDKGRVEGGGSSSFPLGFIYHV